MTDADLIARIRAGDKDAADVLVRRYYDDCWRFVYIGDAVAHLYRLRSSR